MCFRQCANTEFIPLSHLLPFEQIHTHNVKILGIYVWAHRTSVFHSLLALAVIVVCRGVSLRSIFCSMCILLSCSQLMGTLHSCSTHANRKSKVCSNIALTGNFYVVYFFLFAIALLCCNMV